MSAPGTDTAIYTPPDADGIAIVTLDHFPVNSLSTNVNNGARPSAGRFRLRVPLCASLRWREAAAAAALAARPVCKGVH